MVGCVLVRDTSLVLFLFASSCQVVHVRHVGRVLNVGAEITINN